MKLHRQRLQQQQHLTQLLQRQQLAQMLYASSKPTKTDITRGMLNSQFCRLRGKHMLETQQDAVRMCVRCHVVY